MKSRRSEQGSLFTIVVIILVIALISFIGFIFWMKFVDKSEASTPTIDRLSQDK